MTIDPVTPLHPGETSERSDLLGALNKHRWLFRVTVQGLGDEQAALRPTASQLCLGGLIKHVARTEDRWARFIEQGPSVMDSGSPAEWTLEFQMDPTDTLSGLLDDYEQVAQRTNELVAKLPDLDVSQPLPEAPWFPPGERWSARRVILHIIAETAQHAGHADIIRETIDGAKSMG